MKRNNDIKDYLRGNQKGKVANRLEREALSDPFLFEALEGLTTTPGDPIDGLIRLERQLNERACSSRKGRTWLYVAASFVVFAICGSLWFTVLQEKDIMSDSELAQLPAQGTTSGTNALPFPEGAGVPLSGTADSMRETRAGHSLGQVKQKVAEDVAVMDIAENQGRSLASARTNDSGRFEARQTRTVANVVSGIVIDMQGMPLPGVTVMLVGAATGTVTDIKGYFRVNIPAPKGTLSFHFVGMKAQGLSVSAGDRLQVKMEEEQRGLEEVVVTGYQTLERRSVVSSITTMKADAGIDSLVAAEDVANFNRYVERALKYPVEDLEKNNQGVIKLSFELNKKRVPSRIRIQDGFSKESNKEIIRLLAGAPKWENSLSEKSIYASVRFVIGKDGQKNTAILTIEKQGE